MSSCSFTSVCDAYDGGIVHSLNNPYASLTASNTSFIGCCRTRNVKCEGNADNKKQPGRQNETENGENSFIWCEWNGSKATEMSEDYTKQASNGGAIFMYGLTSGSLTVSHCAFNECSSYWCGGGIMCNTIRAVTIESSTFNCCVSTNRYGGGVYILSASFCARVSGCEFKNCQAIDYGGGLKLENFQVSETGCIGTENGEGESACVFDCIFTSCSVTGSNGGGMYCVTVPNQFKMRSVQFISCSASTHGGGMRLYPNAPTTPDDGIYCYFLFYHECKCSNNPSYGHDVHFSDRYNLYFDSGNPFYECYTTNADDQRVCYGYNYTDSKGWTYGQTSKKNWLKDKAIYVSANGNDTSPLCGSNESNPCLTVKKALEMCEVQISLTVTLMEGDHTSEATTIAIGTKKISVIGRGKDKSSIGIGTLSFSSFPSLL